jgi:hypothetical protein
VTNHKETIVQMIREITELYDRNAQLWMILQEDEKIQELDMKEERVNTVV